MSSSPLAPAMKKARIDRGLTQADLARAIGVSRSAISQIESGANNPSMETVEAWMTACGRSIRFFLAPASSVIGRHEPVASDLLESIYTLSPTRVEILWRVLYLLEHGSPSQVVPIAMALPDAPMSPHRDFWSELADELLRAEQATDSSGEEALAVASVFGIRGLPDILRKRSHEKGS